MLGDVLWVVVPIAVLGGMLWLAARLEPHWVAKDRQRFLTTAAPVDGRGRLLGRPREVRAALTDDGRLLVARRARMRTQHEPMTVAGRAPDPPRGKVVFLLDAIPPDAAGTRLSLRLPAGSPMVPVLDGLVNPPRTGRVERPPDPR